MNFLFRLRILAMTLAVMLSQHSFFAQGYKPKNAELVELNSIRSSGWHFAPGLTYMIPFKPKGEDAPVVKPGGRLAIYAEVGRYRIFSGGGNVFNYMDYSIGYKRLSGKEEFEAEKSVFKQNFLVGNFNINNIIQLSSFTFIQNSLGVNGDFKFSQKMQPSSSPIADNTQRFLFSLHYKLGFGYKATKNLFVIPTLETPILNLTEWERGRSDYGIYSSRYRPLIFTVRFAWTTKPSKGSCPPVPGGKGDKKNYDDMLKME
jgi:hypothetical protein